MSAGAGGTGVEKRNFPPPGIHLRSPLWPLDFTARTIVSSQTPPPAPPTSSHIPLPSVRRWEGRTRLEMPTNRAPFVSLSSPEERKVPPVAHAHTCYSCASGPSLHSGALWMFGVTMELQKAYKASGRPGNQGGQKPVGGAVAKRLRWCRTRCTACPFCRAHPLRTPRWELLRRTPTRLYLPPPSEASEGSLPSLLHPRLFSLPPNLSCAATLYLFPAASLPSSPTQPHPLHPISIPLHLGSLLLSFIQSIGLAMFFLSAPCCSGPCFFSL